ETTPPFLECVEGEHHVSADIGHLRYGSLLEDVAEEVSSRYPGDNAKVVLERFLASLLGPCIVRVRCGPVGRIANGAPPDIEGVLRIRNDNDLTDSRTRCTLWGYYRDV